MVIKGILKMKHKHHIIPKHMGGTDDPSNLVELTIEEQAEAHRKLFEEHGHWQDELAWKGLSGQIGAEEIISKRISMANTGKVLSDEHKRRISEAKKGKKLSEDHKAALREAQLKSKNHSTRGKKRPEHSEKMKGYPHPKKPCPNCGREITVTAMGMHRKACTN